jgi:hypothetical protein
MLQEVTGIEATSDGLSGSLAPGGIQEKWIVPKRYSSPKTSDLKATVRERMGEVELKLWSESAKGQVTSNS